MVVHGSGLGGNKLDSRPDLQVGGVIHPYLRPMDLSLFRLKKKISAGADFLLTQAVFDLDGFSSWMDAVRAAGLEKRTAIIPSVLALPGVNEAQALRQRGTYGPIPDEVIARISQAPDPFEEGVAIASEIAMQLKDMPGVRGIHILGGGPESPAADVFRQAKIGEELAVGIVASQTREEGGVAAM
jgi:methylenetetrahydrofolate reductase (NADPH)